MKQVNRHFVLTLFSLFFFGLLFTACQEEEAILQEAPELVSDVSIESNLMAEDEFDDVDNFTMQATEDNLELIEKSGELKDSSAGSSIWSCATVTIRRNDTTRVVVIDFGEEGCEGEDGRVRKGKIITSVRTSYLKSGSRSTTTFEDYQVNGVKISGTRIVSNVTENGQAPRQRIQVIEGQIIFPDQTSILWETDRIREWSAGFDTPLVLRDDVVRLIGNYQGKNREDVNFSAQVLEPVVYRTACRLQGFRRPSAGKVLYSSDNREQDLLVDYGDGACDSDISVSVSVSE